MKEGEDIFHINSRLMAVSRCETCDACGVMVNVEDIIGEGERSPGRQLYLVPELGNLRMWKLRSPLLRMQNCQRVLLLLLFDVHCILFPNSGTCGCGN